MSIDPAHLHQCVVRPVLREMAAAARDERFASREAEMLIMGTCAVESRLGDLLRQSVNGRPSGTGLGAWQVEPATAEDLLVRYLRKPRNAGLREYVREVWPCLRPGWSPPHNPTAQLALMGDLRLGCLVARLRYWTASDPLPDVQDVEGQGRYWVENYNRGGDGAVEKYVNAWQWHLSGWAERGGLD